MARKDHISAWKGFGLKKSAGRRMHGSTLARQSAVYRTASRVGQCGKKTRWRDSRHKIQLRGQLSVDRRAEQQGQPVASRELLELASRHNISIERAALAQERMCLSRRFQPFERALFSLDLSPAELEDFEAANGNIWLYQRLREGQVNREFVARYRHCNTSAFKGLEDFSKITMNAEWDRMPRLVALWLYAGRTPQEIALNHVFDPIELTRAEAYRWTQSLIGKDDQFLYLGSPRAFLCQELGISEYEHQFQCCSRALYTWFSRKKDLPAMSKGRSFHGAGGESKPYCYLEILDELSEEDLGPAELPLGQRLNATPERVFKSAQRRGLELAADKIGPYAELPRAELPKGLPPEIRQLQIARELLQEGDALQHCVGRYLKPCLDGRSFIFSVQRDGSRSTVELAPAESDDKGGYQLIQHKARLNMTPDPSHVLLVEEWCAANEIAIAENVYP